MSIVLLHEIANPLTTAMAAIEYVLRDAQPGLMYQAESIQELGVSLSCLSHIQQLVKEKQRSSAQPIHQQFFISVELEAITELYQAKIVQHAIDLQVRCSAALFLEGNPTHFRQIVGNVLSNAIDACEKRPLRRVIITAKKSKNGARIRVHDTGVGMTTQAINRIFMPFFTTKEKDKGSGIGLSLTKELLEKEFAGKIRATSKPNEGSTFQIAFPARTML